jgi:HD superfamily phosphodiesterase
MTFSLDFPAGPMAAAVLSVIRSSESPSVANHSVRSFFFAQLLAAREGCLDDAAYDRDLLFAATVMHDLGADDLAHGADRFEVEGADLAASVLREHGVPDRDVDRVWEAIALHTSPGIAERRGLLAYLTREGVGIDFGRRTEVVASREKEIHAAYPASRWPGR